MNSDSCGWGCSTWLGLGDSGGGGRVSNEWVSPSLTPQAGRSTAVSPLWAALSINEQGSEIQTR